MKEMVAIELQSLKERMATASARPVSPWPIARVRAPLADLAPLPCHQENFARPLPPASAPHATASVSLHGIERRLVRRVEALWHSLCPPGGLPPQSAATRLLADPFGAHGALFRVPPASRLNPAPEPVVRSIGARLEMLGAGSGTARSALMRRLARLAADATGSGRPAFYDSETETPGIRIGRHGPALMVRAIGLPLAPPARGGASAVVIASWRELLSARDTQALQQELVSAIAWMREHGFSTPA